MRKSKQANIGVVVVVNDGGSDLGCRIEISPLDSNEKTHDIINFGLLPTLTVAVADMSGPVFIDYPPRG